MLCIPKVIDPCNLLLYQVVLGICLIVFYFVLCPRVGLFQKYVKLECKEKTFVLWKVNLFCLRGLCFIQLVFSPRL